MNSRGRSQESGSSSLQLMTVSKTGVDLFWVDSALSPTVPMTPAHSWKNVEVATYSGDGSQIAVAARDSDTPSIALYDTNMFQLIAKWETGGEVKKLHFSPNCNFLVALLKFPDQTAKNVYVWNISQARNGQTELVDTLLIKTSSSNWPPIRWSNGEKICCRRIGNAVIVSPGSDPIGNSEASQKIEAEHVQEFSVSPELANGSVNIAVFTRPPKSRDSGSKAQRKDGDAPKVTPSARIINSNNLQKIVNHKSFPRSEDCTFKWNSSGDALTAITSTDVDITGKSYYGNTFVHFMRADSSYSHGVADTETGTVHDIHWIPTTSDFCLLRGQMPSELLICEGSKGEPKTTLGKVRRNTIRWDPFGQFVAVGGFGNLPGDIIVWSHRTSSKVSEIRARCTVECDWAPDGRHLLAATTCPRLRMDNCVKIFRYTGKLLNKVDFDELTAVSWRPTTTGVFSRRDHSPTAGEEITAAAQLLKLSTSSGVYRPAGATSNAQTLRTEDKLMARPYSLPSRGTPGAVPGATAQMSGSKNKNKNKKNKAIESGFIHETAEDDQLPETSTFFMPPPASPLTMIEEPEPEEEEKVLTLEEHEKQVAYFTKKITEIKALKTKGGPLNKAQSDKIKKEKQFKKDLQYHQNAVNELNSK
eukprot:Selendium_serpulae@DN2937_c0_g1_i1.p1